MSFLKNLASMPPLKIERKVNLTDDERPEVANLKATHEVLTDSSKSVEEIHDTIQAIYEDKEEMKKDINTTFWMGTGYYTLCSDLIYNTSHTKQGTERTIELLDMIISLGADINTFDTESGKIEKNTRDAYTSNTIAWAVSKGNPDIVKYLLEKGAHIGGDDWVEWFGGHLTSPDYENVLIAINSWKNSKLRKNEAGGGAAGRASPKSKNSAGSKRKARKRKQRKSTRKLK